MAFFAADGRLPTATVDGSVTVVSCRATIGLTHVTAAILSLTGRRKPRSGVRGRRQRDRLPVPAAVRRPIGIEPPGRDGQTGELNFGHARVRFMGWETVTEVVIRDDEVEPILGVVALECTGFGVDPPTRAGTDGGQAARGAPPPDVQVDRIRARIPRASASAARSPGHRVAGAV